MSHSPDSSGRHRPALDRDGWVVFVGAVLIVAWGVLAFGSPYPWAYIPLAAGAALVGLVSWLGTRSSHLLGDQRRMALGLGLVILAVTAQLLPLPPRVVDWASPANSVVLNHIDLAFAASRVAGDAPAQPSRPLSINPVFTTRALFLLVSFALLLVGLTRHCNRFGVRRLSACLTALGFLVALIGIIQKAVLGDQAWDGMKIYGFWTPMNLLTTPFGPFVNKNHFAGWMLMALPVALGYLLAQGAVAFRHVRPGWRHRFLWLSSPEGGRLQIAAFAIMVMAVSLLMTLSRSGIACFGMAMAVAAVAVARGQQSKRARIGVVLAIAMLAAAPLMWANSNLRQRLVVNDQSFGLRRVIWSDAWHVVQDFPATGTGLNTFSSAMLMYQTHAEQLAVWQAHNDYLQLAAEGGLLVGLPIVLALALFVASVRQRFRSGEDDPATSWMRFGAAVGLAAIALQSTVEFSLQMPGNAVALIVLAAMAIHRPSRARASTLAVRSVTSSAARVSN
jgi:O-antigen ligase